MNNRAGVSNSHPACVISQFDAKGRWNILDCIFGEHELINDFGNRVKQFLNLSFTNYAIRSYCDPAGEQESDKSLRTSAQILGDIGFAVTSRPSNTSQTNYDARKTIIEGKLKTLIDGVPALVGGLPDAGVGGFVVGLEGEPHADDVGFVVWGGFAYVHGWVLVAESKWVCCCSSGVRSVGGRGVGAIENNL